MCKANSDIIAKVQELMELRRIAEELQSEIEPFRKPSRASWAAKKP